ncbi:uncharacterized protein LOC144607202 [Rhinoraja longicauda]
MSRDRAVGFLHRALRHHDARSLEKWLKRADPNLVLPDGTAALHLACGQDTEAALRCVKLLLQQGADPNVRSSEDLTPLHVAASWGCIKCVKLLLKNGADPTLLDQDGQNAVDLARDQGHVRCCQLLLQYRDYTLLEDSRDDGPVLRYVGFRRVSSGLHPFAAGAQSRVTDAHRTTGLPRGREESPTARGTRRSLAGSEWELVPGSPGRGQGVRSSSVGDPVGEVTSVWSRGISAAAESWSSCDPADIPKGGDEDRGVGEASELLPESCVLSSTRLSNSGHCAEQTLNGLDSAADSVGDPTPSSHELVLQDSRGCVLATSQQLPLAASPGPHTSIDDESFLPPSAAGAPHPGSQRSHTSICLHPGINQPDTSIYPHPGSQGSNASIYLHPVINEPDTSICPRPWSQRSYISIYPRPGCQGFRSSISPHSAINGSDTTICPSPGTQPRPDKCLGDQHSPPVQCADQSSCAEWLSELDCTCAPSVRSQTSRSPWNPQLTGLSDSELRARSPRGEGTDGTSTDRTRGRFLPDRDKADEADLSCANAPDNGSSSLGLWEGAGCSGSSDLPYCSCDSECEVFASAIVSFSRSYRSQPDQEHPAIPSVTGCPSTPAAHCDASAPRYQLGTVPERPDPQPGREIPQHCPDSEQIPGLGEDGADGERTGDISRTDGSERRSKEVRSSEGGSSLGDEGRLSPFVTLRSKRRLATRARQTPESPLFDQSVPMATRTRRVRARPGRGGGGLPGYSSSQRDTSGTGGDGDRSPPLARPSSGEDADLDTVPFVWGEGAARGRGSASFDTVPFVWGRDEELAGAAQGQRAELGRDGGASGCGQRAELGRDGGASGCGQRAELGRGGGASGWGQRDMRLTRAVRGPGGGVDWGGGVADHVQGQRAELGQGGGASGFVRGQGEGSEMSLDAGRTGSARGDGQEAGLGRGGELAGQGPGAEVGWGGGAPGCDWGQYQRSELGGDEELAAQGQGVGLGRGSGGAVCVLDQSQGVESNRVVASSGSAAVPPGEVGPVERGFGALPPSYTESAGGSGRAGATVSSNPGQPDGCLYKTLGAPTQGGSKASGPGPRESETQWEGGTEGSCSPSPRPPAGRVLSGGLEWQRPRGPGGQHPVSVSPVGRPLSGGVGEAVEYLYTDTEGSHSVIECCYPSGEHSLCHPPALAPNLCHPSTPETSHSRHPPSDPDTTLVYDWRSYRSSRGGLGGKENVQPSDLLPSQTSPSDRHPRQPSPSGVCSCDPGPGSPCQSDPCPSVVCQSQASPRAQPPSTPKPSGPCPALAEVSPRLLLLSNIQILQQLRECGQDPGPVTDRTRAVYLLRLHRARREPQRPPAPGYSPELARCLDKFQFPDCSQDEMALVQQFDQPDPNRKWREGLVKSSFNYLLLDPRVTRNLPVRCHSLCSSECFRTFVRAIFYVGKGKRARPYCHLYEALTHFKRGSRKVNARLQHIVEIWGTGCGVISLHCFQGVIPAEAYTREACMVDALGLEMLTNRKRGDYYGVATTWSQRRRRQLGALMLRRAMDIFLAEGERQLRPADV